MADVAIEGMILGTTVDRSHLQENRVSITFELFMVPCAA